MVKNWEEEEKVRVKVHIPGGRSVFWNPKDDVTLVSY